MSRRERTIRNTLSIRKVCRLVEHDVHNIAERIRDIEPDYFVLQNMKNGCYEVHSTANQGDTLCFGVPFDALDSRTLEYCKKTSTSRNIASQIDKNNARIYRENKRKRDSEMRDRTSEMAERLGYAMECDELHDGYKRTFSF